MVERKVRYAGGGFLGRHTRKNCRAKKSGKKIRGTSVLISTDELRYHDKRRTDILKQMESLL